MSRSTLAGALILFATLFSAAALAADTVVVVVRHAEKATDDAKDPTLSASGQARAARLAEVLRHVDLSAVYTTHFKRTQQTAQPTAAAQDVKVQVRPVNAENSATYADDLRQEIETKQAGKSVLVVGHSNTVPGLVKAISGKAVADIPETDYDRIYIITLADGKSRLVEARYGD
jgi:broad specificity phosphatase PhoE